ncbi:hypothetical protein JCM19237_6788 [Photobacterium aphoticum]|uniref:Uncharacterized protein n=1 Tax=Photobacterium aphoticum TaxID=754436 RepID=A0A090QYR2_9GAMM|nr:hypothetical protein JCM19237_6788 [Photobacterium aphoticum]
MRHHQHGLMLGGKALHQAQNFPDPFRIQRGCGSSNSNNSGAKAMARPIPTRCCCPPDRAAG